MAGGPPPPTVPTVQKDQQSQHQPPFAHVTATSRTNGAFVSSLEPQNRPQGEVLRFVIPPKINGTRLFFCFIYSIYFKQTQRVR